MNFERSCLQPQSRCGFGPPGFGASGGSRSVEVGDKITQHRRYEARLKPLLLLLLLLQHH